MALLYVVSVQARIPLCNMVRRFCCAADCTQMRKYLSKLALDIYKDLEGEKWMYEEHSGHGAKCKLRAMWLYCGACHESEWPNDEPRKPGRRRKAEASSTSSGGASCAPQFRLRSETPLLIDAYAAQDRGLPDIDPEEYSTEFSHAIKRHRAAAEIEATEFEAMFEEHHWETHISHEYRMPYYWNSVTKESRWHMPPEMKSPE